MHLLKIEYSKLRYYRTFWVMLFIYALMVPLALMGIASFELPPIFRGTDNLTFPTVWNFVTYVASIFNMLLGILVVLLVTNDFNFRTFKQNIIDGLSKQQVILSKFIMILVLAFTVAAYTAILAIVFGYFYTDELTLMFDEFHYIGIYFVQTLGYFTLAFYWQFF